MARVRTPAVPEVRLRVRARKVPHRASLHGVRSVAGHRQAAGLHRRCRDVGRGAGRRVLGAVCRATGAHNGRASRTSGGYASRAGDRYAAPPYYQPLDLRPHVTVVLGRLLFRRPMEHLRLFRRCGRRPMVRPQRSHVTQHAFICVLVGRVPSVPFQRVRPGTCLPGATVRLGRVSVRVVVVTAASRGVSTNIGRRTVLDDFRKRIHHRLKRVFDEYRKIVSPRRRPFDSGRFVGRRAVQPIRVTTAHHRATSETATVQWRREYSMPNDLAPDGHLLWLLLRFQNGLFHVSVGVMVVRLQFSV